MEEYLPIFEFIYFLIDGNEEFLTGGMLGFYMTQNPALSRLLRKRK